VANQARVEAQTPRRFACDCSESRLAPPLVGSPPTAASWSTFSLGERFRMAPALLPSTARNRAPERLRIMTDKPAGVAATHVVADETANSSFSTARLSVIIPVLDGAGFVGRAIASAQAIPVEGLEIVAVNDGSTDGTLDLLRGLAKEDPRLVVVHRDRNRGPSAARNEGVAAARAEIVCFLDADDALFAEPISRRLEWHEAHPEAALSFADYQTVLPDGSVEPRFAAYWPRFERFLNGRRGMIELGASAFGLLFGENPICTTGSMARRSALLAAGGFASDLRQAEDWDMWIRLSLEGGVAYSTVVEALHAARPGSLSSDVDERTRGVVEVMRRHLGLALRRHPVAALAAMSTVEIARAEQRRFADRNVSAWTHYLAGFLLRPNVQLARECLRATAVLAGLREGRVASFEERTEA
jgi:GT2 family glycosyltransferase